MAKKQIKPPLKLTPSGTIESLKAEYFDPEYTLCSPRLSENGSRSNTQENLNNLIRSQSQQALSLSATKKVETPSRVKSRNTYRDLSVPKQLSPTFKNFQFSKLRRDPFSKTIGGDLAK